MSQLTLCLALAKNAFKVTGEYDAAIFEFKAKPKADPTFAKCLIFTVNKYTKHIKCNKMMAKSVGFGIVNAMQDVKTTPEDEAAWAIANIENATQQAHEKQMNKFM